MTIYNKNPSCSSVNPYLPEQIEEEAIEPKPPQKSPEVRDHSFQFVQRLGQDLEAGDFDLPPFPDTATKIHACIQDPNSDIQSLAAIVTTEPALAARLMRMANSAMMRRGPIEVTDIATAISRVGMEMVENAAVSFAAREAFKAPPGSPCLGDLNKLRRFSITVAAICYVLAGEVRGIRKPEEAMLAGLFNSVGKFYIFMRAADHEELFTDRAALDELSATWHTGVARAIVESWGFPENIAVAVDEQEVAERDRLGAVDLSDLLFVGNLLAQGGLEEAEHLGDLDALARMRMDAATLAEILEENKEGIQSMIAAMV